MTTETYNNADREYKGTLEALKVANDLIQVAKDRLEQTPPHVNIFRIDSRKIERDRNKIAAIVDEWIEDSLKS